MLFCDMLRSNTLKTINQSLKRETEFDKWLNDIGGCTYINSFTPAPDTPRSLACFYTGLYPKNNGCTTRIQWPKYYLHKNKETIFKYFHKNDYKIHTNFSNNEIETGYLTEEDAKYINNYLSFLDLIESIKNNHKNKKELFFINLQDYHYCISDYSSLSLGAKEGNKKLVEVLKLFFENFDKDSFDYTFIFSDHGCKLQNDKLNPHHDYLLLNDNRSKIFMHMRKKNDKHLIIDKRLRTIMDIYPTVIDLINNDSKKDLDGISLLKKESHKFIVMEDSTTFLAHLGNFNNIWRYKEYDFSYYLSLRDNHLCIDNNNLNRSFLKKIDHNLIKSIINKIEIISCSYKDLKKQNDILNLYAKMDKNYQDSYFSNGTKRIPYMKNLIYKVLSKLISLFFKLKYSIINFYNKNY